MLKFHCVVAPSGKATAYVNRAIRASAYLSPAGAGSGNRLGVEGIIPIFPPPRRFASTLPTLGEGEWRRSLRHVLPYAIISGRCHRAYPL